MFGCFQDVNVNLAEKREKMGSTEAHNSNNVFACHHSGEKSYLISE
jgi:hypothetical protein